MTNTLKTVVNKDDLILRYDRQRRKSMKISAMAIMTFEDTDFKILSYENLFYFKTKEVFFSAVAMKKFLAPLSSENFTDSFTKSIETGIKKSGQKLFDLQEDTGMLDFKNDGKKYKIYFQKEDHLIFAYLLRQLNISEINDIKSKAITEFSVDGPVDDKMSDFLKNKKKVIH